ncbi:M48 family metalloprotease [Sphingomonas sediminicola]|jgi:predicted Zn-dependent protease|uniref:M48 family metalloprotease n=1 Tax=Sphingomonas sediminicola TaxID=386874 RepID=A0ABX6TB01_9SPHN|nr:M48 family metalloprotease [Sphingomonas sediminicola]QNP46170.1 M48 family metalloprotease [Sphingomonas sediminicola]
MSSPLSRFVRMLMLALVLGLASARPAVAADEGPSILRDTETEALFADIAKPLVEAANLDNKSVKVVLLNDDEINAFVAGSQNVYVNSGLLTRADNVNQLQFVIAHELGHVAGGHAIRMGEGMKEATGITLATMVLGAIAIAAGAGDAGLGLMMMGQRAAMGQFLAFTRAQETSADLAGASYLHKAGISGKGGLDFFKKLQNQEYRLAIYATDSYDRTHPLSSERISILTNLFEKDPAWNKPTDPALEARFQRVKAKLVGFINPKQAISKYPETDQTVPAHYARAYAYHLGAYPDKALAEADSLLKTNPHDPYFLELKGQILLESGQPAEAIAPLREATEKSGRAPLIASMLGHALISTENQKNMEEAKGILKTAVAVDNENPFAWYQLGIIYDSEGDTPRAALATAERNNLEGNPKLALASAEMAMRGIPAGTPDYLRAQDIAMVSKIELKKDKKGRDRE